MVKKITFLSIVLSISLSTAALADTYKGKKILYVNSYHEGYEWSDGITQGMKMVLEDTEIDLKIIHMDTKRNTSEAFMKNAGLQVKHAINEFKPDVVITSDDNAFKYVVMPYYQDAVLPVVFCGVNWDVSEYGGPYTNTTGMIEVNLIPELYPILQKYAGGNRLGFLAGDVLSETKLIKNIKSIFGMTFAQESYVTTFAQWKAQFLQLQDEVDVLLVENNAGIDGWDTEEAERFVLEHAQIPTGSTNDWMMPCVLIGLTKVPEEQGIWAAQTALQVLDGAIPSQIPLSRNTQGKLIINMKMADRLGVVFELPELANAEIRR